MIFDMYGFRMPGNPGTDLFIGGILCLPVGVTNGCCGYAVNPGKVGFDTPETAPGQPDFFIINFLFGIYRQGPRQYYPPLNHDLVARVCNCAQKKSCNKAINSKTAQRDIGRCERML